MLENDLVGLGGADRSADLPERRRPDLSVVMHSPVNVLGIMFGSIEPPQARRICRAIGGGIPLRDARVLKASAELGADRAGPIIAKTLTHRVSLQGSTVPWDLIVEDGMAVLMPNDLGIFSVIHPAGAIGNGLRIRLIEGIVFLGPIH